MVGAEPKKVVQLYIYTMTVERIKKTADDTAYNIDAVVQAFTDLLTSVNAKDILAKTHHLSKKSKVIWLDYVEAKGKGCFNLVFKSAKYDQSRTVRNTETMEDLGVLKKPEDGDEEKTHLLIRFRADANRFVAAIESNYYGVGTGDIAAYLNDNFDQANSGSDAQYAFKVSFDILPSEEFLKGLYRMKKTNVLRITLDIADLQQDDFKRFAGRGDIRQTVDIAIHKKRGKNNNIPKDLIRDIYLNTGGLKTIKRIAVEGTNQAGSLKIDSDSYQMKHSITVDASQLPTHEIQTTDFFQKAEEFFTEMGL